jgi:NodT family efflux transporter outer membrane factor (OMF) lipoprotein
MSRAASTGQWWWTLHPSIPPISLLLAGCATHVPQVLTPQITPKSFSVEIGTTEGTWPQPNWWQSFGSSELSELIENAHIANRDLAVATARVMEAQARTTIQRAALFPQINAQAQALRAPSGQSGQSLNGQSFSAGNSFGLTFGASYELDAWGLTRDNLRAAKEAQKSARFTQQATVLTGSANVANSYFSVLALRARIAIANEDIAAINGILDIIKLRVSTGKSSRLDLAQEQAQMESVKAQLPMLEQQELQARVALAVLLGEPPEGFDITTQTLDAFHLPSAQTGLPCELLLRRPDVAEAEANLAGAHANLDAARAAFLPQFSLASNGSFASTAINALLHGPIFAWDFGANLLQTIFDGGKLGGQKDLAEATQKELIASYQSAVLNAFADVENALGQVANNSKAELHLKREVQAAGEAFRISQLQYRQGATELLTVLQAQQTLFAAEDQLAQTQLAHMQAVIHLFEALGGGWIEPPEERTQFASGQSGRK